MMTGIDSSQGSPSQPGDIESATISASANFWKYAFRGTAIGFGLDMAFGLIFEATVMPSLRVPGEPVLTYGQPAFVLALACGLLGAGSGIGISLWQRGNRIAGCSLVILDALLMFRFASWHWIQSIKDFGIDPSDWVVYVPCCVASLIVLVVAMYSLGIAVCRLSLFNRSQ